MLLPLTSENEFQFFFTIHFKTNVSVGSEYSVRTLANHLIISRTAHSLRCLFDKTENMSNRSDQVIKISC